MCALVRCRLGDVLIASYGPAASAATRFLTSPLHAGTALCSFCAASHPVPQSAPESQMAELAQPLSVALPGTWELLSRRDVTDGGEPRTDPSLGADPVALLIYDGSGHFAAQFMKRDRSAA